MTNQTTALQIARGMMDNGMSADDANVEVVRMMGVRIVQGRLDRQLRTALMRAVKEGRLGHLKKEGFKPEAFFHPNSLWEAKGQRSKIENEAKIALQAVRKTVFCQTSAPPAQSVWQYLLPPGFSITSYPSTVEIRGADGRFVGGFPKPYSAQPREWWEANIKSAVSGGTEGVSI